MSFIGHTLSGLAATPPPPPMPLGASSGSHPDTIAAAHMGAEAGQTPGTRPAVTLGGGTQQQNFTSPTGQKQVLGG
jgi:hypothetical protein